MRDQPAGETTEEERESLVLALLLDASVTRPWSIDELARELGSEMHAVDAVAGLHGVGLVHRCDGFVFATRAATHFSRLCGGL